MNGEHLTLAIIISMFAANIILAGLGLAIIKVWLTGIKNEVQKSVDDLWKAINTHGHKGLDCNGSKVTRG
ncbi:hypothetical protein ACFL2O_11225 [Thermodesulfobacteriota bacterium]